MDFKHIISAKGGDIAAGHFQRGVAEHDLEGELVAAVAEVVDSGGMAEGVGAGPGAGDDSGAAVTLDEDVYAVFGEGAVFFREPEFRPGIIAAGEEIFEKGAAGGFADTDLAAFGTFAHDVNGFTVKINIDKFKAGHLLQPDTGIQEEAEDGVVTDFQEGTAGAEGKEVADIFEGEGEDNGPGEFGRVHVLHGVFAYDFFPDKPVIKGFDGAVMDVNGGWFKAGLEKDVEIEPDIIPGDGEGIAVGEKA